MIRSLLPHSLLLLILLTGHALAQSTKYSTPENNLIEGRPPADAELGLGSLSVRSYLGYHNKYYDNGVLYDLSYAFPVANSALGRDWAGNGPLQWQIANGYSVVPLLVEIEHRHPSAQNIRVEVLSSRPYAREELQHLAGDPGEDMLSRQLAVFSVDLLVPPGRPMSFVLTPRYIPEARPGTSVHFKVQTYFNNADSPDDTEDLDVIVLDPAHLYFLNLDGPIALPDELSINAVNELDLDFASNARFDPSILTTTLYGIPTRREVFTGAPLAARDFAFVTADAEQAAQWPEEEQQALESYMLAGGRLCLYNMREPWRGFDNGHDSPVGRGYLLAESADYEAARAALRAWVEGELEEFILITGGSVRGESASTSAGNALFGNFGLRLEQVYGADKLTGILPARRPGFLHPVWLYRELSSDNAVEPWDFPEYQLRRPRAAGGLGRGIRLNSVATDTRPAELALLDAVVPARPLPLLYLAMLAILAAAMALLARSRPRRQLASICVLLPALLLVWLTQSALDYRPVRLRLLDRDIRTPLAISRNLSVLLSDSSGRNLLSMSPDALIRRVVWSPPGKFNQQRGRESSEFSGRSPAQSVNLYVDATLRDAPQFPVGIELQQDGDRISLQLDTSRLAVGQYCLLQSPLGYQAVPAGSDSTTIHMKLADLPVRPGLDRIRAIRNLYEGGPGPGDSNIARFASMLSSLRRSLYDDERGSLGDICWTGLLRQPCGLLGVNQNQLVLSVVDPQLDISGQGAQEVTVQRMCLPLGGGR